MNTKKRILSLALVIIIAVQSLLFAVSCKDKTVDVAEKTLDDIFLKYRSEGLSTWIDVVAMFDSNENPIDYKNFDSVLTQYTDGTNAGSMAKYLLIADIAAIIGAQTDTFEFYEEYKTKLREIFDSFNSPESFETYMLAYVALKAAKVEFDDKGLISYINENRKEDGSYPAVSKGETGDLQTTAMLMPLLTMLADKDDGIKNSLSATFAFIKSKANDDRTYNNADGVASLTATSYAYSAQIAYNKYIGESTEIDIAGPTEKFKDKNQVFYKSIKDGDENKDATSLALIAFYDKRVGESVYTCIVRDGQTPPPTVADVGVTG